MDKNRILRLSVLIFLLVFTGGCELALIGTGATIGVGTYRYVEGSVERDYPVAFSPAWDATNTALANLYLSVTDSVNEGLKGTIEAVGKDGTKVVARLKDNGQNITTISIRVGFFGNRNDAERIHEEIRAVTGLK